MNVDLDHKCLRHDHRDVRPAGTGRDLSRPDDGHEPQSTPAGCHARHGDRLPASSLFLPSQAPAFSTYLASRSGAFRIAGGLLLFWIAFEMIFEKRHERQEKSAERGDHKGSHLQCLGVSARHPADCGPGAISAVILLAGSFYQPVERSGADRCHHCRIACAVRLPGDCRSA
jgi:hypothetical protein